MDPDEALQNLRDLVAQIQHSGGKFATVEERQFADQFAALDEWLTAKGFLPLDWRGARRGALGALPVDEDESTWRWLCRYCGMVIPGVVSSRPCPGSPDQQHRRGERWHEPA